MDSCLEVFDEDQIEELMDYFMEADSDDVSVALEEFNDDYDEDDLRLFRLKFISEVGNWCMNGFNPV